MKNEDVVMTLFKKLPPSYKYMITTLETMPMKELTMECMTVHLMHVISKRKEKKL